MGHQHHCTGGNPKRSTPTKRHGNKHWVQPGGCLLPPAPSLVFSVSCPCNHPGRPRHARAAARPVRRGRTPLCSFLSVYTQTPSLVAIATLASLPSPPSLLPLSPKSPAHASDRFFPSIAAAVTNNGRCLHHVVATSGFGGAVLHSNSRGLHEARSFFQLCKRPLLLINSVNIVFCFLTITDAE